MASFSLSTSDVTHAAYTGSASKRTYAFSMEVPCTNGATK